ncbi:MAG: helix-turn-helix domain-containing protein [Gammaproteobacteria bacterium]|nr:helix-turn-helix domain-containing protein [Gammaproteobacteria bacterium]
MTTEELFQRALKVSPPREIAARLGLHANTVRRWMKRRRVPGSYRGDFLRVLGMQYCGGSARDKDQFFTKPEIAEKCFKSFCAVAKNLGANLGAYHFIEPSAGDGGFYQLLPKNRRTGIDIEPIANAPDGGEIIRRDYLTWMPKTSAENLRYAVIGNPPFGLRGHLALQFINHSQKFADLVGFILPPLFDSDGKGAAGKRVRGFHLAHTEKLPDGAFAYPDGRAVNVACIFQVWSKIGAEKIRQPRRRTCAEFIKVYSLSDGGTPSSTRNKKMLHACDLYMPSTCFSGMTLYRDFESLPQRRGYGVVIHKRKRDILRLLKKTDWSKAAFTSTNGALNLRASLIEKVVTEGNFYDGK